MGAATAKAHQTLIDTEARVNKEKDDAVAAVSAELEKAKEDAKQELRKAKADVNAACDTKTARLKASQNEAMNTQRGLTKQALDDSAANMANKNKACKASRDFLRNEL